MGFELGANIGLRTRPELADHMTGGDDAHFTRNLWRMAAMQAGKKASRELVAGTGEVDDVFDLLGRDLDRLFGVENHRAIGAISYGAEQIMFGEMRGQLARVLAAK